MIPIQEDDRCRGDIGAHRLVEGQGREQGDQQGPVPGADQAVTTGTLRDQDNRMPETAAPMETPQIHEAIMSPDTPATWAAWMMMIAGGMGDQHGQEARCHRRHRPEITAQARRHRPILCRHA